MTDENPTGAESPHSFDSQVEGIAALAEPVRRALYRYVISQLHPVSRDQVAEGAGVPRHVAKFHLDKLLDDGLLAVEYARAPGGRRGPGAGRPSKLYRRSSRELSVSLPQRDYELAGKLMARAIVEAGREGVAIGDALGQVARDTGRTFGRQARTAAGEHPDASTLLASAESVLSECGYEPRRDDEGLTLINCPFHALATDYRDLVCGMNLELMVGLVDGLEDSRLQARLEPAPDRCCVRLRAFTRT